MMVNKRPLKVIVTNEGAIKKYHDG